MIPDRLEHKLDNSMVRVSVNLLEDNDRVRLRGSIRVSNDLR